MSAVWEGERANDRFVYIPVLFIPGSAIGFYNSSWSRNKQDFKFVSRWVLFSLNLSYTIGFYVHLRYHLLNLLVFMSKRSIKVHIPTKILTSLVTMYIIINIIYIHVTHLRSRYKISRCGEG